MAEKKIVEIDVNTKDAVKSMDNLSKSANDVSASFADVYGELQPLTARMGEAEDRLYELANAGKTTTQEYKDLLKTVGDYRKVQIKTDMAVDAAASTMGQKLGGALSGATSGFSIVQGAMGAMGAESVQLEATLLKVQSAIAISEGVRGFREAIPSIKAFGAAMKTAIGSTGIGLLVVALGTLAVYWDDIKSAVSGVSDEQENLNAKTDANLAAQEAKLEAIDGQDNILKLQGKTEKQILELKLKQIDAVIAATEATLVQQESTKKAQVAAAKRNREILEGVLTFLTAPLQVLLGAIDSVGSALGKDFGLRKGLNRGIASLVFDPNAVKEEADKTIDETKKKLDELKNQRAGFQLSIKQIDKDAEDKAAQALKDKNKTVKKETEKEFESYEKLEIKKADLLKHSELTLQGHVNKTVKIQTDAAELELAILEAKATKAAQLDAKAQSEKVKLVKAGFDTIAQITELFGKKSEKAARNAFRIQKAASMASALISTYQSARSAYASQFVPLPDPSSPVRGAIAAGIAIASGLANVAKIGQQKFEGGGSTGGGGGGSVPSGGGGGGVVMSPNFNVVGNSGINQLAQLQQTPTKAYVVSSDVTSGQSLDRNRIENATLVQ
jgi:hypothetical protein